MLDQMVGAARAELLPIAWKDWRPLDDGEGMKRVDNPTLPTLELLEFARAFDAVHHPWAHPPIDLVWLVKRRGPALSTKFLGRTIVFELPDSLDGLS
jgi:hypothetical protein